MGKISIDKKRLITALFSLVFFYGAFAFSEENKIFTRRDLLKRYGAGLKSKNTDLLKRQIPAAREWKESDMDKPCTSEDLIATLPYAMGLGSEVKGGPESAGAVLQKEGIYLPKDTSSKQSMGIFFSEQIDKRFAVQQTVLGGVPVPEPLKVSVPGIVQRPEGDDGKVETDPLAGLANKPPAAAGAVGAARDVGTGGEAEGTGETGDAAEAADAEDAGEAGNIGSVVEAGATGAAEDTGDTETTEDTGDTETTGAAESAEDKGGTGEKGTQDAPKETQLPTVTFPPESQTPPTETVPATAPPDVTVTPAPSPAPKPTAGPSPTPAPTNPMTVPPTQIPTEQPTTTPPTTTATPSSS